MKSCKYVFSFIQDDRIIYSWWLSGLNIQFNVFRCIRCFDRNFESSLIFEPNTPLASLLLSHATKIISVTLEILERKLYFM